MRKRILALLITSSLVLALLPTFLTPQPVGADTGIVIDSNTGTANPLGSQPQFTGVFEYAVGRYWVFQFDGTNYWNYRSSTDGTTWTGETAIVDTKSSRFAVWVEDDTYCHIAYRNENASNNVYYNRGIMLGNGTISWGAASYIGIPSSDWVDICVDSDGYPWIALNGWTDNDVWVSKSSAKNGTWVTATGWPQGISGQSGVCWGVNIEPLLQGQVAVFYQTQNGYLYCKAWNGLVWGSAETAINGQGYPQVGFSTLSFNGKLYALQSTAGYIYYNERSLVGTWGTKQVVTASATLGLGSIAYDAIGDDVYAFWSRPSNEKIYYNVRNGSSWGSPTVLLDETVDGIASSQIYVAALRPIPNGVTGVCYPTTTTGTTPYQLKCHFVTTTASTPTIYTSYVDGVTSTTATLHGLIQDDGGNTIDKRGVQYGLSETPTWEVYETDYTTYSQTASGADSSMWAAFRWRIGQRVTVSDKDMVSVQFAIAKHGSATGNVTYTIRAVLGDTILASGVLCDASELLEDYMEWNTVTFESPVNVDEEVRFLAEYNGGNSGNYVYMARSISDVAPGNHTFYDGSYSDVSSYDISYKYTYETSGDYGEGYYGLDLEGLDDNSTYHYRAFMVTNTSTTYYGEWTTFTTSNLPVMQTNVASSVAMTTARLNSVVLSDGDSPVTVTFGWGNSSQYFMEFYDHYEVLPGTYDEGEHPYLDIDGLLPSTLYYFRVQGENVNGYDLGDQLTFTTENLTGTVQNFKGVPSATSISLSWDLLTGASTYLIRFKFGSYPTSTTDGTQAYSGSSTSTIHGDLSAGTTYYYAIWGESGGVYSPNSTTLMLTTSAYIEPGDTLPTPPEPSNWMAAPDYERMAGLGYFYDGVNGTADRLEIPRATLWFLLCFGLCLLLTLLFYLKIRESRGAGTLTLVVLTFLLFGGLVIGLMPFWFPLLSLIAVVTLSLTHKEVTQ